MIAVFTSATPTARIHAAVESSQSASVSTVTVLSTASPSSSASSSDASASSSGASSSGSAATASTTGTDATASSSSSSSSAAPPATQIVIVLQVPTPSPAPSSSASSSSSDSFPDDLSTIAPANGFCAVGQQGPCSDYVVITASAVTATTNQAAIETGRPAAASVGFFSNLSESPGKIAATVIVSFIIAAVVAGLVAWIVRCCCLARRRRSHPPAVPPRPPRPDEQYEYEYDEYGYPIEKSVDGDYTPRTLSPLPEEEPYQTQRRQYSYGVGSEYTPRDRQGHQRDASGGSFVSSLTGDQTGSVREAQVLQVPARTPVVSSSPRAMVVRQGLADEPEGPLPAYPSGVMSGYYLPRDDEELVPPPRGKSLPTRNAPVDVPIYPVALPRQIFPPAHLKPQPRGASLAKPLPNARTSLPYETPSPSMAGSDSPSVGVALGTPSIDQHAMAPTPGLMTPLEEGGYFGHRISQGAHPSMTPLYGPTMSRAHSLSSRWTSSSDEHPDDLDVVDIDMSAYGYDSTPGTSLHSDSARNSKAIDTPTIAETLSAIPSPLAPLGESNRAGYPFPAVVPYAPEQKNLPATPRPLSIRKSFDAGRRFSPELPPTATTAAKFEEVRLDDGSEDESEDVDDTSRFQREVRRGSLKPQPIELDDDLDVIAFPHTPSNFSYAGTPMPLRTPMSVFSARSGGPGAYPFPPVMAVSPLPTPGGMAEVGIGRPSTKRTSTTNRRISAAAIALERHEKVDPGRRSRSAGLTF